MSAARILHLEDSALDAELVEATLLADGLEPRVTLVDDRAGLISALEGGELDLVLCDHSLPGFGGAAALAEVRSRHPGLPVVFVSGAIGEDQAIELMRAGATDYVLKSRLSRLAPAVRRALAESEERRRREAAEVALRESHRFIERIASASPLLLFIREFSTGRCLYVNGRLASLLGECVPGARGEGEGEPPAVHPDDGPALAELAARLAEADDESIVEAEYRVRQGNGEWRWLHASEVVFERDGRGLPRQILGAALDVTEQKEMAARALRSQRLESIGTLAGGIAHDLNNVLAPVLLAVEMLQRRHATAGDQRLLSTIATSTQRGADLVRQILTFARGVEGVRAPVAAQELMQGAAALLRETLPAAVEIRLDVVPGLPPVLGDSTQLHQVLLNLCVNARDAMPNGGVLSLAAESAELDERYVRLHPEARTGSFVLFSVADTGEGIPLAIRERIFEPFFTTKEVGKGTGLGLSTTHAIVKSHGGFINVYSEVGRGTAFKVYLPAAASDVASAPGGEEAEPPTGRDELILVVDDEEPILDLVRECLLANAYRVVTAADGSEAVALFARSAEPFAAVITDLRMPIMDGAATIRALRRLEPGLRILAASGLADRDDLPGVEVIRKPYTARALLTALRRVLDLPLLEADDERVRRA